MESSWPTESVDLLESLGQEYEGPHCFTIKAPVSEICLRPAFWKSGWDGERNGIARVVWGGTLVICWRKHKLGLVSADFAIYLIQGVSFALRQSCVCNWEYTHFLLMHNNKKIKTGQTQMLRFALNFLAARPCTLHSGKRLHLFPFVSSLL